MLKTKTRRIALVKVEPFNFMIKQKDERNSIINGFQAFLNSLDFPVQIVMLTDKLNLDPYLKRAEERVEKAINKTGNKKYEEIFESFKQYFTKVINSATVSNRSFYIAIPEVDDLDVQVKIVSDKLKSMGLRNRTLNDEEITNVLARFFNNLHEDSDKREYAFEELKQENLTLYDISPKYIKNHTDFIQVNDVLNRVVCATGYPRQVEPGFLNRIVTADGDFDVSIHIEPFAIENTMLDLNRELQKQRADMFSQQSKNILNPSLEIKYKDTRAILENLQKGTEKMFNVSLYINCRAKNKQELTLLTKKVESELNSVMIIPRKPLFRMAQGLKSVMPICKNQLNMKRNIPTGALSAFFPFTSQFLQIDNNGIWLGLNKNNVPVIRDIFTLANSNGVILAGSGAGKSYTAKLMISRHLLNGTGVIIIDPQSEYGALAKEYDGELITISKNSETIINPLDLMGHEYDDKRLSLLDLFSVMLGDLSEIQKAVIDRAIGSMYAKKGITADSSTWNKKPPILGDLLSELKNMAQKSSGMESETYRSLISRLTMYVTGVFNFLNKQTNLKFGKQFVCFNIGTMPKQVKPVIMFLILDYVYMKMKTDKGRKLLIIDEAWSLLQRTQEEGYIFEIVKTCRKYRMGLLLITQDVADLLGSKAGNALLSNSSYTFLLRQNPSVIDQVVRTFRLSPTEKEKLLTAMVGEGLLIVENDHTELKVVASEAENKIFSTHYTPKTKTKEKTKTKLDLNKGYFKKADLKTKDISALIENGYIVSRHVGLNGGAATPYLLKLRSNETPGHCYLTMAIKEYLQQHTNNITTPTSRDADIIFTAHKQKWAIEIETGTVPKGNINEFKQKIKQLKQKYENRWIIVATTWNLLSLYRKHNCPTYLRTDIPKLIRNIFKQKGA